MIAGAAGQDEDTVDVFEDTFGLRAEPTGLNGLGAAQHVEGVDDGPRLFEDFFLHVVGIIAQFYGIGRKLGFGFFPGDGGAILTGDGDAIRSKNSDITVLKIDHAAGNLQERGSVGGGIVGIVC